MTTYRKWQIGLCTVACISMMVNTALFSAALSASSPFAGAYFAALVLGTTSFVSLSYRMLRPADDYEIVQAVETERPACLKNCGSILCEHPKAHALGEPRSFGDVTYDGEQLMPIINQDGTRTGAYYDKKQNRILTPVAGRILMRHYPTTNYERSTTDKDNPFYI